MNFMKKISIALSLICLLSCSKVENSDLLWIDIDKNGFSEFLLSDVAEDISLVTLQTSEESFITFISDLKSYKNNSKMIIQPFKKKLKIQNYEVKLNEFKNEIKMIFIIIIEKSVVCYITKTLNIFK